MAEVRPQDILLRIGGRTLHRYGVLAVSGASRGRIEDLKETFTRPAQVRRYRDRDGIGRKAGADTVAIEYPSILSGLVDQFGFPYCGPLLEGARTQLVTQPENFAHADWIQNGTPTLTPGQSDPFGGTTAYTLTDNDITQTENINTVVAFTADATKVVLIFMRNGLTNPTYFGLWDNTALVWRHRVDVTWSGGVPTLATGVGSGTLFPVASYGNNWWMLAASVNNVVAANNNRFYIAATADAVGGTGSVDIFGANAWNAPFASSYQGPGESAGVADSLT
ncbi:MAG: phage head spike fiber domain-containing protein, partial [Gammaproteobacteria bacterium]